MRDVETFHGLLADRSVRQRLRWHLWILVLLFTSVLVAQTNATVVVPLSEEALIEDAAAVVIGRVTLIQAGYDHSRPAIFTNITLAAEEVIKGPASVGEITLRQPGGSFGDIHSWVGGNQHFGLGEKVLIFLRLSRGGSFRVAHLYQGKFTVFLDPTSGEEYATRETPQSSTTPQRCPRIFPASQHANVCRRFKLPPRATRRTNWTCVHTSASGPMP